MTHRGVATSVRFLTGHARDGAEQVSSTRALRLHVRLAPVFFHLQGAYYHVR